MEPNADPMADHRQTLDTEFLVVHTHSPSMGINQIGPVLTVDRAQPDTDDCTVDWECLAEGYWPGTPPGDGTISIQMSIAGELAWIRFDAYAMRAICQYEIDRLKK